MKRIFRFATFLLLVGGWTLSAASLHVARIGQKVLVIPKDRLGFHDTYTDIGKWTLTDLPNHAALIRRLTQRGQQGVLSSVLGTSDPIEMQTKLESAMAGPATPTSQPAVVQMFKQDAKTAVHSVEKEVKTIFDH